MTKSEFARRVHKELSTELSVGDIETLIDTIFDEIKEVARENDSIQINGFGKFYAKNLKPRTVNCGFMEGKRYRVPAKKKIGFSSFASTDEYISQPVDTFEEHGLFGEMALLMGDKD